MGADTFIQESEGANAEEAFNNAVNKARQWYGDRGYTGSMAEKEEFVLIDFKQTENQTVEEFIDKLIEHQDERIDDKWGPAGCIQISENKFIFFGWASS